MTDLYETEDLLRQYLDFHYRSREPDYLPRHDPPEEWTDYPVRCADVTAEYLAENAPYEPYTDGRITRVD